MTPNTPPLWSCDHVVTAAHSATHNEAGELEALDSSVGESTLRYRKTPHGDVYSHTTKGEAFIYNVHGDGLVTMCQSAHPDEVNAAVQKLEGLMTVSEALREAALELQPHDHVSQLGCVPITNGDFKSNGAQV